MALRYGEYRESVDIDFLVSDQKGYRALRGLLTAKEGIQALAKEGKILVQSRPVRADQYGIRTVLKVGTAQIKLEIVLEGRIELETSGPDDQICGVSTLTPLDMATSKLLANSDCWADKSILSRDLIDLAMMRPSKKQLGQAIDKASQAYSSIQRDLGLAIGYIRAHPHYLEECMLQLQMTLPRAVVFDRICALSWAV